jgi:dihydrofolate reductase
MTRFVYATATTLDGYLADPNHSLDWLFVVEGGDESLSQLDEFVAGVAVLVMGSSTYRWLLDHESLLEHPEKWPEWYGDRPTYIFTSRTDLTTIPGADIRIVGGDVAQHLSDIRTTADGRDVWLVGGGDLVGQFADAGALDEMRISIAPVTLGEGAPLLPRRLDSARLHLESVEQVGQFVQARYSVGPLPTNPALA